MKMNNELQTINAQCQSLTKVGVLSELYFSIQYERMAYYVICMRGNKLLRFSDPDLNVIISQLAHIYKQGVNKHAYTNTKRKSKNNYWRKH